MMSPRSKQGGFLLNPFRFGVPSARSQKWNSADCSADLVLSDGDMTVTRGPAALNYSAVRSVDAITGKRYGEYNITDFDFSAGPGQHVFGISDLSESLSGNYSFSGTGNFGFATLEGKFYSGGVNIADAPFTCSEGTRLFFAIDATDGKFWVGKPGYGVDGWDGSPSSGTGSRVTFSGTRYLALALYRQLYKGTLIVDPGSFIGTPPAGFAPFD